MDQPNRYFIIRESWNQNELGGIGRWVQIDRWTFHPQEVDLEPGFLEGVRDAVQDREKLEAWETLEA